MDGCWIKQNIDNEMRSKENLQREEVLQHVIDDESESINCCHTNHMQMYLNDQGKERIPTKAYLRLIY